MNAPHRLHAGRILRVPPVFPAPSRFRDPREVKDPGPRGLNSLRVRPRRRYRLPVCARDATLTALDRDMLLQLRHGGLILLRDLITIEVMAEPAIFELGEQDLPAHVVAALGLASDAGISLDGLLTQACQAPFRGDGGFCTVLAALRRDGTLPAATLEWELS
ncbi:MAG: hypothetical protein ACFCUW_14225 [Kiloniellaceae bacterium]